jgi:hypothetical protein
MSVKKGPGSMKLPWAAGRVLNPDEFEVYYRQVIHDCRHCSIRPAEYRQSLLDFPLLMMPGEWPKLARLAEKLSEEVAAAEQELLHRPDLYESLGLRTSIAKVLKGCRPADRPKGFARVMRFDFCFTEDGWKFTECNPDTAGGFVEAYGLTKALAAYYPGFSPPPNPAAAYADAIHKSAGPGGRVAIFHPRSRVASWTPQFIQNEVEKRGMRGILVNPRHLTWKSNRAVVSTPAGSVIPDFLIRRLMAKWLPSLREIAVWTPWFCGSRTPISNPGHSILVESKRFALICKELDTQLIEYCAFSPESRSPNAVPQRSQTDWVFKPAFGCIGQGIGIAGATPKSLFEKISEAARRNTLKWVAQRRFQSVPLTTERGLGHACLGIYTIDGIAGGAFGRIRGKPLIDGYAPSIAVLIPQRDIQESKSRG